MLHDTAVEAVAPNARVPVTHAGKTAVEEQLKRILDHSLFKQSKRYPSVLRYMVEQALMGGTNGSGLKERAIGIDVCGRDPMYDTATDPVVRVIVSRIRKRLTLYYQEPGHESEIRIDLPSGSYIPEFWLPGHWEAQDEPHHQHQRSRWTYLWSGWLPKLILAVVGVTLMAGARMLIPPQKSALDLFWGPVLQGANSVLLCVAETADVWGTKPTLEYSAASSVHSIPMTLVSSLSSLGDFLNSRGLVHPVKAASETTIADLRNSPAVLMGFNNYWTARVTANMRFQLRYDGSIGMSWVEDEQNPSRRDWAQKFPGGGREWSTYALIARAYDPITQRVVVTVAGLTGRGTRTALDFLVNPNLMNSVVSQAPKGWQNQNLEIVIKTPVINEIPAAPQVMATHFW